MGKFAFKVMSLSLWSPQKEVPFTYALLPKESKGNIKDQGTEKS